MVMGTSRFGNRNWDPCIETESPISIHSLLGVKAWFPGIGMNSVLIWVSDWAVPISKSVHMIPVLSIRGFMFTHLPISKWWSLFWYGDSIFTISKQGSRYQNGYDGVTDHHFNMVILDPSTRIKTDITILLWVFNILHFETGIPISKWVWLY